MMADIPDAARPGIATLAHAGAATSTPAHVLVVDDNAMNRDVLSRRLQRNGHTVEYRARR